MLLVGHVQILKEAIKKAGLWSFFNDSKDEFLGYKLLESGVKFPDVPCATRSVSYNKEANNLKVIMENYRLCNPMDLLSKLAAKKGYKDDIFSEAYLSHNFLLAYLHSMTPTPDQTTSQVLKNILQLAKVFLSLSAHDVTAKTGPRPNNFWIGVLLHMIMDSFSPAHCMRFGHFNESKSVSLVKLMKAMKRLNIRDGHKPVDLSMDAIMIVLESVARDIISAKSTIKNPSGIAKDRQQSIWNEAVNGNFKKLIIDKLQEYHLPMQMYPNEPKREKDLIQMFYSIYMYEKLKHDYKVSNHDASGNASGSSDEWRKYRIMNFLYYNNQSHSRHAMKDTIKYIKYKHKKEYYDYIVSVCAVIIKSFYEFTEDVAHHSDYDKIKKLQNKYVSKCMQFLREKVFYLHPHCEDIPSGYDVSLIKAEFIGQNGENDNLNNSYPAYVHQDESHSLDETKVEKQPFLESFLKRFSRSKKTL